MYKYMDSMNHAYFSIMYYLDSFPEIDWHSALFWADSTYKWVTKLWVEWGIYRFKALVN